MEEGVDDGGEWVDLLDLEVLLEGLERISTRRARVVELRFFGGLGTAEVADLLA
jgi:DNA-directed RNA polymerase specialized sigma24 family protein